ncbi:MAG: hypothetical protein Q4B18_00590 [Bacillota bacterium]|nr:hypothetical protein [Bacillota bacterium]
MLEKLLKDPAAKDKFIKIFAALIIIGVLLLSFDVFTTSKDGRRQIVDEDGGVEAELCLILSDIDGVGDVDVMLQYDNNEEITGAIVTASGAGDPVIKNNVINAVMALFNISAASVEVFEKTTIVDDRED